MSLKEPAKSMPVMGPVRTGPEGHFSLSDNQPQPRRSIESTTTTVVDIEHAVVENDPRQWSRFRKNFSLFLVAAASMIAGLGGNIQSPAVVEMSADLSATNQQFSLSLALFICIQGVMPLAWCAISEVKGRRLVYLLSLAVFTIASVAVAISNRIELVIAFRAIQAAGSSAVIAIGAATLADIFDPVERGTKMGIYLAAPFLGPALGPIIGGALTTSLGWRSIFWFLCVVSAASFLSFIFFFRDTFRKERSLIYQNVVRQRLREKEGDKAEKSSRKTFASSDTTTPASTVDLRSGDLEKAKAEHTPTAAPQLDIELSLADVNPFKPIIAVVRRINNLAILLASAIMFAMSYSLSYTTARTLSASYHANALKIGLITISYGIGCVAGSLLGGRWSDYKLTQLKEAHGGKSSPEMRLKSTVFGLCMLPPFVVAYGWVCEKHVHIAVLCAFLFGIGFVSIWTYSSALAYLVDANNGRSGTTVATNSAFRGISAFIAVEIAVPLQDGIGDGWLYTVWGALMLLTSLIILLVALKGDAWRTAAEERDAQQLAETAR